MAFASFPFQPRGVALQPNSTDLLEKTSHQARVLRDGVTSQTTLGVQVGDIQTSNRILGQLRANQGTGLLHYQDPGPHHGRGLERHAWDGSAVYFQQFPPNVIPARIPMETGFGVDLDGNGRFEQGKDGILAFDFDGNGSLSQQEIDRSRRVLKTFGDPNFGQQQIGDLSAEQVEDGILRAHLDRNGDNKLDRAELKAARAKLWVDRDGDGLGDNGELFNSENFRDRFGRLRELVEVDGTGVTSASKEFGPPIQRPLYPQQFYGFFQQFLWMMMGGFGNRF